MLACRGRRQTLDSSSQTLGLLLTATAAGSLPGILAGFRHPGTSRCVSDNQDLDLAAGLQGVAAIQAPSASTTLSVPSAKGSVLFLLFFQGLTGEGQGLTASFSLVRVEGRTSLHRQEAARSEVVVPGPRMPRPHSVAAALTAHPATTCCTYKQDDAFQGSYHASCCSATEALSHMLDTA